MIELKNIDLTGITLKEQMNKVSEEETELLDALNKYNLSINSKEREYSREHIKEEYCDVVQVWLGLLDKYGITAKEVMEYYPKHLKKLEHRPR